MRNKGKNDTPLRDEDLHRRFGARSEASSSDRLVSAWDDADTVSVFETCVPSSISLGAESEGASSGSNLILALFFLALDLEAGFARGLGLSSFDLLCAGALLRAHGRLPPPHSPPHPLQREKRRTQHQH